MNKPEESGQEIEALRERIRALSAAILRISESLDLNTVLHEVLEGARALTDARYGVIATIDAAGQLQDFITSGFSKEERQQMVEWPEGPRLFEHLRDLPSALRLADLRAYVRLLGYSGDLMPETSMQATPMRHRGVHVGTFFMGDKAGGQEFTSEDEEVLLLFAAQAATAIVNARTHRDEQRARADLEALIETSPVGVVVFDAHTGKPLSVNQEAKRIVADLLVSSRSLEQALEVLTCRYADGRVVTLDEIRDTERVRAQEVVLSVPDGPSVTTLINATPIHSADGELVSVVVTMQDLSPLEELERLRAEFLGMVSHELRAPLTSIKGSAATVLGASPALDSLEMLQFFRIIDEQSDHMRGLIGDLLDAGHIAAGTLSVTPEPAPMAELVEQARNTFLSGGGRHAVMIDLPPDLPRVRVDRRRIAQVLNNLLANAAKHSPEASPIRITAAREGAYVEVSVADEGRGIPPDRLPYLFRKYAGDRQRGDGYGLGLAICKGLVEAHGGRIRAESGGAGRGTRFAFTIPVTETDGRAAAGVPASASRSPGEGQEPTSVLVVDDDPSALRYIRNTLERAGYAVHATGDPGTLSDLFKTAKPDLVLLDLILPETDGIELMESVSGLANLPVIFVSGYGRDETVSRALQTGAADYIVKPFSPTELTSRIAAALRKHAGPESFRIKGLTIDFERRQASVDGRPVLLTATEFELLRMLAINAGRVMTYDALLRQVWGEHEGGSSALVRTFIKNLRRKLGDHASRPTYILTARGVGYRMAEPNSP